MRFRSELKKCKKRMKMLRVGHDEESKRELNLMRRNFNVLLAQEEDHWRQRAKLFWLKEGDANTRFFHAFANARKKYNKIVKLQDENGGWFSDPVGIQRIAQSYFEKLFSQSTGNYEPVLSTITSSISHEDNLLLMTPFKNEEFRVALFQMDPEKAPGPDGLIRHFIRSFGICWEMISLILASVGLTEVCSHRILTLQILHLFLNAQILLP